jgi:hypothetical protein
VRFFHYIVYRKGIGSLPRIVCSGITVADTAENALMIVQQQYKRADFDHAAVSEIQFDATDDV